jgi:hypothetical protein
MAVKQVLLTEKQYKGTYVHYNSEKENMVKIINDLNLTKSDTSRGLVTEFCDHFRMLNRLRIYYPNIKLNAQSHDGFQREHSELSRLEGLIRRGYSTHLIFENDVIREIEKPFKVSYLPPMPVNEPAGHFSNIYEKTFEPKLLKTTEEYSEEGSYMHHCVAGYIDYHKRSIIVSLRCGDDRVTCEFDIKTRVCYQSRYFTNHKPPEYYEIALIQLKDRIQTIPFPISPIDEKRVPFLINGLEVIKEEILEIAEPF